MTKKKNNFKLTDERPFFKPFTYEWAYSAWLKHEQSHWLHTEVEMLQDVKDWKRKLTDNEKYFLTQIFRFFTQGDIDVASAYVKNYLPLFPQPEVRMMLLGFGAREALHVAAYSHLVETLGLPETTYNEFLQYKEMAEKHDYVEEISGLDNTQIAKQIACFSAFTEGMQLFSSFIMLLNFPRHGKMKGMGQIVTWSIVDEAVIAGTQILTKDRGWIPIETLSIDDEIYQYDMVTRRSSFAKLQKIQHVQRDTTYVFEGPNIHQHVSPNHRMIIERDGVVTESTAENLSMADNFKFILSGQTEGKLTKMNDKHKELCVMSATGELTLDWVKEIITEISSDWAKEFLTLYNQSKNT